MNKVVLITGSSTGIGRATAEHFARKGWQVAASMRTPEKCADWASRTGIFCPQLDVTDRTSIDRAVDQTLSRFGRLDVLVNNAGYALMGPLEAWQPADFQQQLDTNLIGLVAVTQRVLPHFREKNSGTVVNVSSIGGRISAPLSGAYFATKWAVEGLSECLQFELRSFGVRVKIVEPGGIRTDFISKGTSWAEHPAYLDQIDIMRRISAGLDARLPGPQGVAAKIFEAANDTSRRLRFPVHHQPYLILRQLLPDALWARIAGSVLERRATTPQPSKRHEVTR